MRLLNFLILFILLNSCSSQKALTSSDGVVQSWLYTKQEFVGNIMTDENGNPIEKGFWFKHFLVLQVDKAFSANWETLSLNDHAFTISKLNLIESDFVLGVQRDSQKSIIIQPNDQYKYILMEFEDHFSEIPFSDNDLVLTGKKANKSVTFHLKANPIFLENEIRP